MSVKTVIVSPYPYYSGTLYAPAPKTTNGVGIWYAYFENTQLANDGESKVVNIAGINASGNVDLFESLADGVRFASQVIVQATAWGVVFNPALEDKWLGIQLDKDGTLLTRAHTAFNNKAANITYGGVLSAGDILRAIAGNSAAAEDAIGEGWISVIATPCL